MKQVWLGLLVCLAGVAAIVFNRFCVEESLKVWIFWRPPVVFARVWVVFWGLVAVFLGLAIIVH